MEKKDEKLRGMKIEGEKLFRRGEKMMKEKRVEQILHFVVQSRVEGKGKIKVKMK